MFLYCERCGRFSRLEAVQRNRGFCDCGNNVWKGVPSDALGKEANETSSIKTVEFDSNSGTPDDGDNVNGVMDLMSNTNSQEVPRATYPKE